jgi:hypothetical protein
MAEAGFQYSIEQSTDLGQVDDWTEVVSNLPFSANPNPTATNPLSLGTLCTHAITIQPTNNERMFYRLRRLGEEPEPTVRDTLLPVNAWTLVRDGAGDGVTTIVGAATDSPVFGDSTPGSKDTESASFSSKWGSVVNLEVNETVSVTGTISYTGTSNGFPYFRMGLYAVGDSDLESSNGGYTTALKQSSVPTNSGAEFYVGRTDGFFMSTAGNSDPFDNSVQTDSPVGDFANSTIYNWEVSLTRTGATSASIVYRITGPSGFSLHSSGSDTNVSVFAIDSFSLLFEGKSNGDSCILGSVKIKVISAP